MSEEPAGREGPAHPHAVARIGAVVFAVLAVATVGAFFVAQRLKSAPTVIQHPSAVPRAFSPRLGLLHVKFGIKEDDSVTVEVVDAQGDAVRTLLDDHQERAYSNVKLTWNGRDDAGRRVPDGQYRIRVLLRDRGRTIVLPTAFLVDTQAPRPKVVRIGPRDGAADTGPEILPRPDHRPAKVYFRASGRDRAVAVFRTSDPGGPVRVLRETLAPRVHSWVWRGRVGGRLAPPGTYVVVIEAKDRAGNLGSSVPLDADGLPHETYGDPFPGHGGITIRRLGVQPPLTPATAGRRATVGVDARGHRYRWGLRVPGRPPVKRGGTADPLLRITVPSGFSSLYRLAITSAGRAAQSFVPVQSPRRHPVLVVLPAVTWQGRNPVDDDGDGRPNTLSAGLPVRLNRVFAGTGLPVGFAQETAPVLALLDAAKDRYDLTTDVALAAGTGPPIAGHKGVILAGTTRWLADPVARELKRWVRAGGRLASFGLGAMQRYVRVGRDGRAFRPTQATSDDLFGVRPLPPRAAPATLVSATDDIGLFARTGGQFGPFAGAGRFEDPAIAGARSAILASAVTPDGTPVILATRFGRGEVLRFPLPGLAAKLAADPELAQVVRNTWTVLSR